MSKQAISTTWMHVHYTVASIGGTPFVTRQGTHNQSTQVALRSGSVFPRRRVHGDANLGACRAGRERLLTNSDSASLQSV